MPNATHPISTLIDYNVSLPSESINLYYTTTNEERCRMLLIDPVEKKSSMASEYLGSENVTQWDGGRCVLVVRLTDVINLIGS